MLGLASGHLLVIRIPTRAGTAFFAAVRLTTLHSEAAQGLHYASQH
jgi:hypothetical protein